MIFDLVNNEPIITIEGLNIPEYKAIWEADKTEGKLRASQYLPYVYHMADYESSYNRLSTEIREKSCKEDYIIDEPTEEEWELINACIDKHKKLKETRSSRLLDAAEFAVDKFTEYFYSIDFIQSLDPAKEARDLASNLEKIGKIMSSIRELKQIAKKDREETATIRKNVKPSAVL